MELRIESLVERPSGRGERAIAIGNFDGLHLGHQKLLTACLESARKTGSVPTALTFDPHPAAVLSPNGPPSLILTRLSQRRGLRELGVEEIVRLTFDQVLAALRPDEFVAQVLIDALKARVVVVGDGFRFGSGRLGDIAALRRLGQGRFETIEVPVLSDDRGPISSSRIREALSQGNLEEARRSLGKRYEIEGVVVHGDHRGRAMGFPTANIDLDGVTALRPGVYAADGILEGETARLRAAVNLGTRPTFEGTRLHLEAHLPGLDRDLYDRSVRLIFLTHLRDERRFDSVEDLKTQLAIDVKQALAAPGARDQESALPGNGPDGIA